MNAKNAVLTGVLIAAVGAAAWLYWPRKVEKGPGDVGSARQVTSQLREIVGAMMVYSHSHAGKIPSADKVSESLISTGVVTEAVFKAPDAKAPEPLFYCVATKAARPFADAPPGGELVVYSNPGLTPGGGVAVGYTDGHAEWLEGDAAKAVLAAVAGRAAPLK